MFASSLKVLLSDHTFNGKQLKPQKSKGRVIVLV